MTDNLNMERCQGRTTHRSKASKKKDATEVNKKEMSCGQVRMKTLPLWFLDRRYKMEDVAWTRKENRDGKVDIILPTRTGRQELSGESTHHNISNHDLNELACTCDGGGMKRAKTYTKTQRWWWKACAQGMLNNSDHSLKNTMQHYTPRI